MKRLKLLVLIELISSIYLAIPSYAQIHVDTFSPTSGWAGTNASAGTLVKIKGTGLNATLEKNEVYFTGTSQSQTEKAKIEWAVSEGGKYSFSGTIGKPGTAGGGLDHPWDIEVDEANGNIYVVNKFNQRIDVFDYGGKFLRMIGNGKLTSPWGICVDSKVNVYVSEQIKQNDGRIAVFDKTGNLIKSIGKGELKDPRDIAVDKSGAVYVIDTNALFIKFDSNGKKIFSLNGPTHEPFSQLVGLGLDRFGYPASSIYLTDRDTNNIYKYNINGLYLGVLEIQDLNYPANFSPESVVVDFQGAVLVQVADGMIIKLDSQLKQTAEIDFKATGAYAHLRAINAKKTLFTVDYQNNTLRLFTPTDTGELWARVPPKAVTGPMRVKSPIGSTVTTDFTVYDASGKVAVDKVEVTQGLGSYPFVIGKETLIYAKIQGLYGQPGRDSATVKINGPASSTYNLSNFQHFDYDYTSKQSIGHFHIPESAIRNPGDYKFQIVIKRDNKTIYQKELFKTFSGTKTVGLVFVRLSDVPNDQWNQKDPFPWFNMKDFLAAISNFARVYPVNTQEIVYRFSGDQYAQELLNTPLDKEALSDLVWKAQIALNKFSELGFPGVRKAIAIIDSKIPKAQSGLGGIAQLNKDRALIFGTSGSRLVHELGHNFGLVPKSWPTHNSAAKSHSINSDFSNESGAPIDVWNSTDDKLYPGSGSGMTATIMNPGGGGGRGLFESIYNNTKVDYWHLFNKFKNTNNPVTYSLTSPISSKTQPLTQKMVLVGTVSLDGMINIVDSYLTEEPIPLSTLEKGEYSLLFRNISGKELKKETFTVSFDLADGGESKTGVFSLVRPFPSETVTVELRHKDKLLKNITRSRKLPIVSKVHVERQKSKFPKISWSAIDPDGDNLTYSIFYSPNRDSGFHPIVGGLKTSSYIWDDRLISGSPEALVKVVASDGINIGHGLSPVFLIPKKPPYAAILSLNDKETFLEGNRINLRGTAYDPEDGILQLSNLKWLLDNRTELGSGDQYDVKIPVPVAAKDKVKMPLEAGNHLISLVALDSDGNEASHSVNITIIADSDRDGFSNDIEKACGSDPNNSSSTCSLWTYAVKFVCGEGEGKLAVKGNYLTTINVRNPAATSVQAEWKLSLGQRELKQPSMHATLKLHADSTKEIECQTIQKQLALEKGLKSGFVVIESPVKLNVVAVYTGSGTDDKLNTLHTERVFPEQRMSCPDLVIEKISRPKWNREIKETSIEVTISNKGNMASSPTTASLIDLALNAEENENNEAVVNIPYLSPNESRILKFFLPYWVYNNNRIEIKVTADDHNNLSECSKNNNSKTFTDQG